LDSLYAELRRCRVHCKPRSKVVDHRTPRPHECDERCRPHVCKPLSNTTIRHVHHVLSGAYKRTSLIPAHRHAQPDTCATS
jgi:hypothetical protein